MAVAVEIDAVFDVGRRQKLRLADFAGEGADHVLQGKIAALDDLQRRQQFALEQFGAAAIMRHGGERADHRHLADVALAVIGFQPPDRDDDLRRHAEPLLDPRQQRGVTLQHLPADVDAPGADAGGDILLEGLVEGAALAAVEGQHRRILRHAGERLRNHRRRNPRRLRLRRHRRHKSVEVAAAARGVSGAWRGRCRTKRPVEACACESLVNGPDCAGHAMGKQREAGLFPLINRRPGQASSASADPGPIAGGIVEARPSTIRLTMPHGVWVPDRRSLCSLVRDDVWWAYAPPLTRRRRSGGPSARWPSDRRRRHSRPGWRRNWARPAGSRRRRASHAL